MILLCLSRLAALIPRANYRYLDVIGCQVREASATLTVQRPSVVDEDSRVVSELVQFHKARIEASQVPSPSPFSLFEVNDDA